MFLFLPLFSNHHLSLLLKDLGRMLASQDLSNGSFCNRQCGLNLGRINVLLGSLLDMRWTATFFGCLSLSFTLIFFVSNFCHLLGGVVVYLIGMTISGCTPCSRSCGFIVCLMG